MSLTNCQQCGCVMVDNPSGMCPNCLRSEELAEDKVAEYLRETARATMDEIASATGVKHKVIMRMIQRGRISSSAQISYPCETCGTQIVIGRVCDICAKNITDHIKVESWQPTKVAESKRAERIHITDMIKKK